MVLTHWKIVAGLLLLQNAVPRIITAAPGQHPFRAADWSELHSAEAVAVTPDGNTILYRVSFGAKSGETTHEWRLIGVDGSNARKLELPAGFDPSGFTRDGAALFGSYTLNKLGQFAEFDLNGLNAQATPRVSVLLPRGIQGAAPSPDGSRFALLADPRPPDALAETRTVIEPDETSIYVVNQDGTGGQWWCSSLNHIASTVVVGAESPTVAWSPDGSLLATISTPAPLQEASDWQRFRTRSWVSHGAAMGRNSRF
jgi:hypothetical protein